MYNPHTLPLSCLAAGVTLLGAASAFAQDSTPAGIMAEQKATSGSSEVASEGFQAAVVEKEEASDATELNIVAGGVLAEGNAKSLSLTAATNFKLRRAKHQLSAAAAFNYGQGAAQGEPVEVTVENYQGRARYDYFFARYVAGFLAASLRSDRFQGLDLRLNVDPGIAYYFIDVEKHQLWAEIGYDLQYDVRDDDSLEIEDEDPLDKTELRHSARVFVGYDNKLNESVGFNAGAEYLQGLSPFEDDVTEKANWQLNVQAGLTAKVSDKFSIASTLGVRYDNNPLPDVESTDFVTALNLVYTLL